MPGPEVVRGVRVVADPSALDLADWPEGAEVVRLAPDDALVLGVTDVRVDDPHAIVEPDHGWVLLRFDHAGFAARVRPHIDWVVSAAPGTLAQGLVAGVPAKVLVDTDGVRLLCGAAYAHELIERVGE